MSEEALKVEDIAHDTEEEIKEAASQGWKAEEDWKGDPPKRGFQTARQFLEIDGKVNTVLKERNGKLLDDIGELQNTMSLLVKDNATQKERALQKERVAHDKEKAKLVDELTKARREAIKEGDADQAEIIDSQIDKVKAAETPRGPDPAFDTWRQSNAWYYPQGEAAPNEDYAEMSVEADIIAAQLNDTGRYRGNSEAFFKAVTAKIKREFPAQFTNPNRDEPGATETTKVPNKSVKKDYNNLPSEAKAACDSFVKDIPGYTKEDYLKSFEWDDES